MRGPAPACSIKEVSLGVQTQGLSWLCSKGECIHITDSPFRCKLGFW